MIDKIMNTDTLTTIATVVSILSGLGATGAISKMLNLAVRLALLESTNEQQSALIATLTNKVDRVESSQNVFDKQYALIDQEVKQINELKVKVETLSDDLSKVKTQITKLEMLVTTGNQSALDMLKNIQNSIIALKK